MRLDQLITGRLTVARNCFLGAGIPLFGSNIGGKVCGYGIYTQANDGYVTELGIEIFVNLGQFIKASSEIEVTESGIVTLVTAELKKAAWPIVVTGLPW
jgi:hypothetical protein